MARDVRRKASAKAKRSQPTTPKKPVERSRGARRAKGAKLAAGKSVATGRSSRLQERAYEEIKELIVSGQAPLGAFLSERRLGEQLGMSKTPVHAALERLEAEGFVAISPQQGVVVRELGVQEVVDLYELRQAVETYVVRKLAGRLSADQIKQLRACIAAQKQQQLEEKSVARAMELDVAFHLMLCRFLGNEQVIACMERCHERMQPVMVRTTQKEPTRERGVLSEHTAIVDAIAEGDGDRAAHCMADHLETGKQINLLPLRL